MLVTLAGIEMVARPVPRQNTPSPMTVTLLGIDIFVRPVQSANACPSMAVTLAGMVTLVSPTHPPNAPAPILVTGKSLIVLGMVSTLPASTVLVTRITMPFFADELFRLINARAEQLYLVMVIAPLLVSYWNWARLVKGNANSINRVTAMLLIPLKNLPVDFCAGETIFLPEFPVACYSSGP